jgi:hypothetical protein
MSTVRTLLAFFILTAGYAEVPKEKINADLDRLMREQRYQDVENYITTNNLLSLKTNLLFNGFLCIKREKIAEAKTVLEEYLENSMHRDIDFEQVIRVADEHPEVSKYLREIGVSRFKLKIPKTIDAEARFDRILAGDNLSGILAALNENSALIASNRKTAYNSIRLASFRHLTIASNPEDPIHNPKEQRQLHGGIGETLYRYLEKIDPAEYSSLQGQLQLASILEGRGEYGPALQLVTMLRDLKSPELAGMEGRIDSLVAVCLEETGFKERAKELFSKIVARRHEPAFSGYAQGAQLHLNAMAVWEHYDKGGLNTKRGTLIPFLLVSSLISAGIVAILLLKHRARGIDTSAKAAACVYCIACLGWIGTGPNVDAAEEGGSAAMPGIFTNSVNLGLLKGTLKKFEWKPTIPAADTVDRVNTSCGCTAVGVNKGDRLTPGQPIPMEIRLSGKMGGNHDESVLLELASGKAVILRFAFEYKPGS